MRKRTSIPMKAMFTFLFSILIITCVLYHVLYTEDETKGKEEGMKKDKLSLNQLQTTISYPGYEGQSKNSASWGTTSKPTEKSVPERYKTAILVIACNRPSVKRCIDSLLKFKSAEMNFPILVSQDCRHKETSDAISFYDNDVKLIQHPGLPHIDVSPDMEHFRGYYKIARHYKLALRVAFNVLNYDNVIIVEDDLEIAPDFYEYFAATIPLLYKDPTLWCISAWNDNGKTGFVRGNDLLYRSDFFPGLGWALTKSVWKELESKWPASFWDDWMRHPNQRKDRACIRPEIPRTKTFGRIGVSNGQFFDHHLKKIELNMEFFPFTKHNMSYLMKDDYDKNFKKMIYNSKLVSGNDIIQRTTETPVVRVQYNSNKEFISLARMFGLMDDLKAGVPRMGYHGVVSFLHGNYRVYLAPPINWTSYNSG